jgi:hypothetical protein
MEDLRAVSRKYPKDKHAKSFFRDQSPGFQFGKKGRETKNQIADLV